MTDNISELKALIETLAKDSSLRKSLEEVLRAELKRKAEEEAQSQAGDNEDNEEEVEDEDDQDEEPGDDKPSEVLDSITEKLDELLQDDEFIAASAGFLLGAVTVGLGALAVSALRK